MKEKNEKNDLFRFLELMSIGAMFFFLVGTGVTDLSMWFLILALYFRVSQGVDVWHYHLNEGEGQ